MAFSSDHIAENYASIRDRVARAAAETGRAADDVSIVGVTKYVGQEEATALARAGCLDLGESRPQSLWDKASAMADADVRWHMIGHLQRNKIRRTLPCVSLIHSVDSTRLLKAIDAEAQALGEPVHVLLEVNISGDPAKHGFAANDLEPLLPTLTSFEQVRVQGLMTMAALEGGPEVAARNFSDLRELRDRLSTDAPENVSLEQLSMGMSRDFEVAIREGATLVRIGSILFE